MTEQNPDLLALREGLPEGPWRIAHHAYLPDGDWAAIYTSDPDLPAVFAPGRVARAIAAILPMLEEIERLRRRPAGMDRVIMVFDGDPVANSFLSEDGEGGFAAGVYRMTEEIKRLRALNTEMRKALKAAELCAPFWHEAVRAILAKTETDQ